MVQPTLAPYAPSRSKEFHIPNTDSSLIAFRLTTLASSSVLGIFWAHILGDAAAALRFLYDLSSLYTGSPLAEPPSFFPHISLPVYPPKPEVISLFDIPQIQAWSLAESIVKYSEAASSSEMMVLRLSGAEIARIKTEHGGETDQDVISAWWTTLLMRAGAQIKRIVYTVNVGPYLQSSS